MKRTIEFRDGDRRNQKRFELLYSSVLIGGSGNGQTARGIDIVRREARLLDALDAVSLVDPDPQAPKLANIEPARVVSVGIVAIEAADFELLKKRLEETPWAPHVARDVVDVVDWLSGAPTQE